MATEWNLSLLYASLDDPQLERDVAKTERAYKKFAKDFTKDTQWLTKPQALAGALERYEALSTLPGERAIYYAFYMRELDGSRSDAEALIMRFDERLTQAGTLILFFENKLAKIAKAQQRIFLKSPLLKEYHYYLERLFLEGKHTLSEGEERVLALTSPPRSSMWVSGVDKLVNKQMIQVGKEKMPINEMMTQVLYIQNTKKRHAWHAAILEKLQSISEFPESEINAVYTNKKINDAMRGFKKPYDATILRYENNPKSVLALTEVVTRNFKLAKKFYALKKEMLELDTMQYADRALPVGKTKKKIDFTQAVKIVKDSFYATSEIYGDIFTRLIDNGQVDVYPKQGKSGGAYCSHSITCPTFLLLNHTDDLNSVYTLAHEMGHAIHTERSKSQKVVYQGYSTAVAETASTFFERIVFDTIYQTLSDADKIVALHNKIQGDVATVFRQIAFFNFELELHTLVRERGWIPKEEMAALLAKHLRAYMGKDVEVPDVEGYAFVYIGHFRNPFYVYSYAFGQLISSVLFDRYKADKNYIHKIDEFLSAGGSATPDKIFKKIGIDITKPEFWEAGIKGIEKDIKALKRHIKK
jgi:oligoendopeptidase F